MTALRKPAPESDAYRIARQRPFMPILSITPSEATSRRLALLWGSYSVRSDDVSNYGEMVAQAVAQAKAVEFAKPGETIVVVAGVPFGKAGSTNNIRVVTV